MREAVGHAVRAEYLYCAMADLARIDNDDELKTACKALFKDIATKLLISEKTVRNHISNVIQKLGVIGRSQAILELLRLNEIKL